MPVMITPTAFLPHNGPPNGRVHQPKVDAGHQRAILDFHIIAAHRYALKGMVVARRDQRPAAHNGIVILRLLDRHAAVESSRFANAAVKFSGMCWTMTIPGVSAGSISRNTLSASVHRGGSHHNHLFGGLDHGLGIGLIHDHIGGIFGSDFPHGAHRP